MNSVISRRTLEDHVNRAMSAGEKQRLWMGSGLYADISPRGVVSFAMKYRHGKKERRLGLGNWPEVSLDEARRAVRRKRSELDRGLAYTHPEISTPVPTFTDAADAWIKAHEGKLAERTLVQVRRYLDACKAGFGKKVITEVLPSDVLAVLRGFEARGAIESARRTRIYAASVFSYALPIDHPHPNPVNKLREKKGLLQKVPKPEAFSSMPAELVPKFLRKLAASNSHPSPRSALRFLILNTMRTGEVLGLLWTDIAKDGKSATIPGERMKSGKSHTIYFSRQARDVLEDIQQFSEGRDHVFPGRDPDGPLSQMALLAALKALEPGYTVHGFRASFRTWVAANKHDREAAERCLAHTKKDKVEAAYNRHAFDKEAAALWQKWADAILSKEKSSK